MEELDTLRNLFLTQHDTLHFHEEESSYRASVVDPSLRPLPFSKSVESDQTTGDQYSRFEGKRAVIAGTCTHFEKRINKRV